MERVFAYVDGFNLYYGLRSTFGKKYLWLDLEAMCQSLLLPNQALAGLKYFTARVRTPADSQRRQSTYIDALLASSFTEVIHGRLQMNTFTCRHCGQKYTKAEEKKTDVAIASHLVADAYEGRYDVALLTSGDSDMVPPVQLVRRIPGRRVVAVFPPRRKSDELKRAAGASLDLSEATVRQAQLPALIRLSNGVELRRPATWR